MSELAEVERLISILVMQEDAETIYSLIQTERNPIFSMEIIPYYALFVQSCQEFIGKNSLPELIAKDLRDIRNHIKGYACSFGKTQKRVAFVDDTQNRDFKEQLKFEFLKKINIHLNLGTYWTDDKKVIGNTQQLADFLAVESMFDPKLKEKNYQMGYQIGSFVSSIRDGFANSFNYHPIIERKYTSVAVNYYCDINTNKKNDLFSKELSKEINLFYLHLLCNMNFVKHILKPLFTDGNTWVFRVEYIVTYYTLHALERLKNHCESNKDIVVEMKDISDISKDGNKIFKTQLRNCMMHYNLENAEVITLKNIDKPFYGIIENCCDGMSYQDYLSDLHSLSDKIINYLETRFDFSNVKLEKL